MLQYCLSTFHLFRDTEAVPDIMARLLARLQAELGIMSRPVVIHCLCDTGVICYQGLAVALRRASLALDIRGVVWDSCPGPYPQVTSHWPCSNVGVGEWQVSVARYAVFAAVFLLCLARDWSQGKAGLTEFFR